jgi:hypothetical protein
VLGAYFGVGVERVAVAVQRGQGDPGRRELGEVGVARVLARPYLRDGQMGRGKEPAGVDLRAVQAEFAQDAQGLGERLVVQDGGVGAELHGCFLTAER